MTGQKSLLLSAGPTIHHCMDYRFEPTVSNVEDSAPQKKKKSGAPQRLFSGEGDQPSTARLPPFFFAASAFVGTPTTKTIEVSPGTSTRHTTDRLDRGGTKW